MKKLENVLVNLSQSQLEDFSIEMSDQRIRFKTAHYNDANIDELVFDGVKAFFYADPNENVQLNKQLPMELSSIVFCDKGFGEFAIIASLEDHKHGNSPIEISIPNFNLCFGEASFFIEANSVTINENRFSLKVQH
jgi:hypothetical protein